MKGGEKFDNASGVHGQCEKAGPRYRKNVVSA